MAMPDYQACMLPILRTLEDGSDHHVREITQRIADHFSLTEAEQQQRLPSGGVAGPS